MVVLGLGYLGTRGQTPARKSPAENLSIVLPALPQHALMHLAAAKGYFAEEGLNVTFLPASHGVMALSFLAQGKADLAVAAEVPFVISVMKGEPLGIAATLLRVSNIHAVIARRDRGIGAPRDLAGKKVGATFGTSGEYFLWAFLIRHKLAPGLVTLVDLPPGQIAQALAKGTIDAATTWYPHVTDAQAALGENALSFTDANVYAQTVVVIGRSEFLKGHAHAMEKLVRAMLKAEQFMQSHPEETLNLVAGWLQIDV
ncbi:MAG: NrtA/SsuA/CpmA family ABC transporter substrate-binding protein, partial [Burkholderiales bacterium]|nr:NrtA/SsuA/CpmA family ABC transporter substrate-binding protein [Burkholderiales bacterium]